MSGFVILWYDETFAQYVHYHRAIVIKAGDYLEVMAHAILCKNPPLAYSWTRGHIITGGFYILFNVKYICYVKVMSTMWTRKSMNISLTRSVNEVKELP